MSRLLKISQMAALAIMAAGLYPATAGAAGIGRIGGDTVAVQPTGRLPIVKIFMTPNKVGRVLRGRGYRDIIWIDRFLPTYVVEACLGPNRYRLRMNRNARIKSQRRVGSCLRTPPPVLHDGLRPPQIRQLLRDRGFYQIVFTDRVLPVYGVTACRGDRRLALRLNRFGDIRDRRRIGTCGFNPNAGGKSLTQIRQMLRRNRYYNIQFTDRHLPGYGARACRGIRRFDLRLNRFGEIRKRRAIGWCKPRSFSEAFKVPLRRITRHQMESNERLRAYDCQDYLESLLESDTIRFDVASDEIRPRNYRLLRRIARTINRCPDARIEIAGHTDSDGSRYDNQDLSERRAESVREFLIDRGVSRRRLRAVGYGEDRPIASNDTRRGKARNRRIEFVVDWDDE